MEGLVGRAKKFVQIVFEDDGKVSEGFESPYHLCVFKASLWQLENTEGQEQTQRWQLRC